MPTKIFPEYLNKGSRGRAVTILQIFLKGLKLNPKMEIDGDYGEQTSVAVLELQKRLTIIQHGNFGPGTRKKVREIYGMDFDALLLSDLEKETVAVFPDGTKVVV